MSELVVTNWFGDLVSHPKVIVEAHSIEDIKQILTRPDRFPSPVRAVGSNHSTAMCGVADGGTLVKMRGMDRILHIGSDTVTAEAGALYIDVARELRARNLQFHVCTEIGNLSVGSAACAGTKDASMPGEYGQVGSYVTGVKMVLPDGSLLETTEDQDPALMEKIRCSYGTFGIVYEATFKVRPLTPVDVFHKTFTLPEFLDALPELKASKVSMFYYIFPFANKITVEFRRYNSEASGKANSRAWAVRNRGWSVIGPMVGRWVDAYAPRRVSYHVINALAAFWRFSLVHRVKSRHTIPVDQIIRYPPLGGRSRYTFSLFAFRVEEYPKILAEFFDFCRDYYRRKEYRSNLAYVGYSIRGDQRALLSYSYFGDVMTLDPVSTGNPGWKEFLFREYNRFCSDRGGVPLLNQTFGVTREIARKAYGDRLDVIAQTQRFYDPHGRMLNEYFRDLFTADEAAVTAR